MPIDDAGHGGNGAPHRPKPVAASVRRVLDHIDENFADPLPLSELAAIAGLSLHRLVTVFRSQVGIPPHRYLCRVRVQQARLLLRQGLPAALVAIDTGFCDQSHLSRHFKRHCGVTPGHFATAARPTLSRSPHSPHLPHFHEVPPCA